MVLLRRTALLLAVLAAFLIGATGAAWAFQRDLLYAAGRPEETPSPDGPDIRVIPLTTTDGERLTAWYRPPADGRPVFLFLPGRMGGLRAQKGRWRRMAGQGAGFLAVNYRGYAGSSGHPTEAGLQEDARAAYAWLAARYPAQRIVIHGFSLGSGVAVRLAAEHPARALVLEAPFTSLEGVLSRRGAPLGALLQDRYASKDWIGRVQAPVLIVHGDADTVVPFAEGRALYGLVPGRKRFVAMRHGDHNTLVRDGLYEHVWRFLNLCGDRGECNHKD